MTLHLVNHSDKIEWILLKSNFDQEVLDCTTHILDAHLHIWLYCALYHAQAQYADMIRSIHKAAALKCKKDTAIAKVEIAKHKCSEATQLLMETKLNLLLMMDALEELLPWEFHDAPKVVSMNQLATEAVIATVQTNPLMLGPPLSITLSTAPLPTGRVKAETCFPFVPIEEDNIITGPAPWRLIRNKPDGALILVHENNFPINYSTNVLCHQIITAMLTATSLTLEAMQLHLKDIITHYLNAKCTFIIPKHGTSKESIYYDEPYNFLVNGPVSTWDYWNTTSTLHTLSDVLTTTLCTLIAQAPQFIWEEWSFVPLSIPEQTTTLQQVAQDLAFPQPGSLLAAIKTKDIYIIHTSTNEQVILEATSHEFQQLIHTLYTMFGTIWLDTLHALINNDPQDMQFLASILPIVVNIAFIQTVEAGCKIVFI